MTDRDESMQRRARHRKNSPAMLHGAGIEFEAKNNGAHLIVTRGSVTVDFWPGTGLWRTRPHDGREHRGVRELIAHMRRQDR